MLNTKRIGASLILLVALATFTQAVMALGLGNASVESYLGQPLRVKIDLIAHPSDNLDSATVGLASAEDFALIGASREAISVPLSFELRQDGEAASILVTSKLPVKDPVIRLIVEVNWTNGRMLREYTLFLDPPSFAAQAPSPQVDQRTGASAKSPPAADGRVQTEAATQRAEPTVPSQQTGAGYSTGEGAEYGPVQGGDTLWKIAANWSSGASLDMNSIMLAIQRENPQAFINDNINLLRRGVILRMPQIEDVRQISAAAARKEALEQKRAFTQLKVATAVETPLADPNSQPPTAPQTSEQAVPEDQLELVPPAAKTEVDGANGFEESAKDSDVSANVEALQAELSRKEEELIVEQQQNQYLQEQISELEGRLQPDQDGNVADTELSQLEDRLREERLSQDSIESESPSAGELAQSEAVTQAPVAQSPVPQVTASSSAEPARAWYRKPMVWLIGLLVLAGAAFAAWWVNRGNAGSLVDAGIPVRDDRTVHHIKDDAEEILKVLKPDRTQVVGSTPDEAENEVTAVAKPQKTHQAPWAEPSEYAELLDEDSTDPEVRLDLARAYISMGDREAARVILDEVMEHGTEAQQGEARKMLDEL